MLRQVLVSLLLLLLLQLLLLLMLLLLLFRGQSFSLLLGMLLRLQT